MSAGQGRPDARPGLHMRPGKRLRAHRARRRWLRALRAVPRMDRYGYRLRSEDSTGRIHGLPVWALIIVAILLGPLFWRLFALVIDVLTTLSSSP